jgi:predicted peroxiredoxin
MEKKDKIVYIVTHADDNPEKAIIPFVLANGARSMG